MNAPEPSEPAYRSLAAELRGRIAAGQYPEGVRLPTEAELATEFGLSRQTVRRAFLELVGDGSVYRIPGRGTFAHENAGRYLRQLGSIEDRMNLSADTEMRVAEPLRAESIRGCGPGCSSIPTSSGGCCSPDPTTPSPSC